MNQVDIFELNKLLKRMREVTGLLKKHEKGRQMQLQRSFAALAYQFKKRVSEIQ